MKVVAACVNVLCEKFMKEKEADYVYYGECGWKKSTLPKCDNCLSILHVLRNAEQEETKIEDFPKEYIEVLEAVSCSVLDKMIVRWRALERLSYKHPCGSKTLARLRRIWEDLIKIRKHYGLSRGCIEPDTFWGQSHGFGTDI